MKCLRCEADIGDGLGLCELCKLQDKSSAKVTNRVQHRTSLLNPEPYPHTIAGRIQRVSDALGTPSGRLFTGAGFVLLIVFIFFKAGGCSFLWGWEFRRPPGITVREAPLQGGLPRNVKPWRHHEFTITPLATFTIRARVVLSAYYGYGLQSKISPYDFTLAWGVMSDTRALKRISFTHFYRFVGWSSEDPPYNWDIINRSISNLHAIPADDAVKAQLKSIAVDDIVTLTGYLVSAFTDDGSGWGSSLTREDTGDGACETMWIERVEIESD